MNAGCAGKTVRSLRTRAIPERLRGVFKTRRYTNPRLPVPTLPFCGTYKGKMSRICRFVFVAISPWVVLLATCINLISTDVYFGEGTGHVPPIILLESSSPVILTDW